MRPRQYEFAYCFISRAALYGYNPFNWLCFGFSQCISVAVAQYFGYGKGKRLREGFSTVLRLGIIDGIVISILGAVMAVPALHLSYLVSAAYGYSSLPGIFFAEVGAWAISGVLHAAAFRTSFRKIAKEHPEMMREEARKDGT